MGATLFSLPLIVSDHRVITAEDGVLSDEDGDGLADEGETASYTTTLRNTGNVRVKTVAVSHSLAQDVLACNKGLEEEETSSQVKDELKVFVFNCVCPPVHG